MIDELRNLPVRRLVHALEKDGFVYRRRKGSQRVYRHADGRRVIHYHKGGETLPLGTLRQILEATRWTEDDLRDTTLAPRGALGCPGVSVPLATPWNRCESHPPPRRCGRAHRSEIRVTSRIPAPAPLWAKRGTARILWPGRFKFP